MTTSKKKKIVRSGISHRKIQKTDIYPDFNDKYTVPKGRDPLDFVVPWQISDHRKNPVSY